MSQRWPVKDESNSIDAGFKYFQNEVGEFVLWYVYDPTHTTVDNIYDTGRPGAGRRWKAPTRLPVLSAWRKEGTQQEVEERGFYPVDTLHLVIGFTQAQQASIAHDLATNSNIHMKDRIVWHGIVWEPSSIQVRGILLERYSVLGVDAQQVKPDELVNDPDFAAYAAAPPSNSGATSGTYGALDEYGPNGMA